MASSPFAASSGLASPDSNLRGRNNINFGTPSREPLASPSPASTLSGSPPASNATIQSLSREVSLSSLRGIFTPSGTPSGRKPVVRADPSMLTCFDSADKELYDLWVPRK